MLLKLNNEAVAIKGRGCADGRNQRNWVSKEDTSSPNVSNDGLIILYIIDAMEGQDIATSEIPVSFLQTDYDKCDTYIKMEGLMETVLKYIDPSHYKCFFI